MSPQNSSDDRNLDPILFQLRGVVHRLESLSEKVDGEFKEIRTEFKNIRDDIVEVRMQGQDHSLRFKQLTWLFSAGGGFGLLAAAAAGLWSYMMFVHH